MRTLTGLTAAIALSACGPLSDGTLPTEPERPLSSAELSVAAASDAFGLNLLREIAAADDAPNLLVSPLSASMALGMTLNGARGSTFDDMRDALGFDSLSQDAINEAYRGLIPQLLARDPDVEFRLANALWYRTGFDVEEPFLEAARTHFRARVSQLDFSDPAAPRTISQWAEQQTGGRIRDLVEQLDPLDMMVLVNAVYFKAPWAQPFHPQATREADFTRADGSGTMVPTMSQDGTFPNLIEDDMIAVELPYADGGFSMVIAMPADGTTLAAFVAALTPERWSELIDSLEEGRIMLRMPKFKFDYDVALKDALSALGMGVAFDPTAANFDGIHHETRDDLYISSVRQKAFIDVHELGTEAAAATSVTVSVTSMPPTIAFDRPFMFAIRERESGTILFIGRVGDPTY